MKDGKPSSIYHPLLNYPPARGSGVPVDPALEYKRADAQDGAAMNRRVFSAAATTLLSFRCVSQPLSAATRVDTLSAEPFFAIEKLILVADRLFYLFKSRLLSSLG